MLQALRIRDFRLLWGGGIVSSLHDMTTWDRDLYQGQVLPPRQQHQLESLVSLATGKPIRRTTLADPAGYGLCLCWCSARSPASSPTGGTGGG